jgi:hypothetical protein
MRPYDVFDNEFFGFVEYALPYEVVVVTWAAFLARVHKIPFPFPLTSTVIT